MAKMSKKRFNFYQSKAWKTMRKYIRIKYKSICQECGKNGFLVHHIKPVTDANLHDEMITLNENNLTLLCIDCHNYIHMNSKYIRNDVEFDTNGQLVKKPPHSRVYKHLN